MSAIRRPRIKVQANLGSKRKPTEDKKPVIIKDEEKDSTTFKCPLSTITPSNINNNNDIPSNNILQKDLQSTGMSTPPQSSRRRRTSSSSSSTNVEEHLDLKPVVSYKTKSDLHLQIPPRVRTESSSSSHSVRESTRIRTESGSSRIRTESVSSNYSESHGPTKKSKMIRDVSNKDRSELTMFDLIYNYTPTANPMVKSELPPPSIKTEQAPAALMPPPPPVSPTLPDDSVAVPILVPQLKIGLNGEVIIDEQSLEIQTTAEKEAKKVLSNSSCIFMDEFTGSNGFYRKQKRTKEWPESETIKFYKCLHTVGTDFTLMMTLFPNRNRRDLKLKFKKEERVNENLIKKALLYPKAFDIAELEKVLAADEEEKRKREEEWNEIKKKKAASKKPKSNERKSKQKLVLTEGEHAYKNEGVLSQNIKKSFKKEKDVIREDDVFVPEEDETQSSSVMEVDVSDMKSELGREIADLKQELLDQILNDDDEEVPLPMEEVQKTATTPELPVVEESNKQPDRAICNRKTWNRKPRKSKVGYCLTDGEKAYEQACVPPKESKKNDVEVESSAMEVDVSYLKSDHVKDMPELKQEMKKEVPLDDNDLEEGEELLCEFVPEEGDAIKSENIIEIDSSTSDKENVDEKILSNDDGSFEDYEDDGGSFYSPDDEEEDEMQSPETDVKNESLNDDLIDDMTPEDIIASVANGSLAVVTSESDDGETIYEVYKMCPNSGELSENPLNLHPEIINVIKMVV